VTRGEKVLVLGPSGSGKSTLAHCINGLIPHAFPGHVEGSLEILGEDAQGLDIFGISKKAGTLLQDTDCQFVGLTAGEDIAFSGENDCIPTDELHRLVMSAAEKTGMAAFLSHAPQDLSGGQKQKVSLAGILTQDTEILLFDEPLANLDPAAGKEAVELIDKLHKDTGKTIIIVEHRLEDVLHRPVDRIILIDDGRIIADQVPAEMLAGGLLRRTGIRQPLYLSALHYGGIEVAGDNSPDHLPSINFDTALFQKNFFSISMTAPPSGASAPSPGAPTQPPRAPLLELRDISFSYDTDEADSPRTLDAISFSMEKGQCVSLVGNNGAGKSTLAKIIAGFYKPLSGELLLEGKDAAALSIKERAEKIGFVMQNPNQMISYPQIFDEAAFGLRNRGAGVAEVKDKVFYALQICGLYPFRNWPVSALSYGQKKRLTIAAILVLGPALIILDEPTAGQDYRHYSEFMEFLETLNQEQGLGLLMITHDMHLMLEYTQKVLVISGGKLIAVDDPAAVLASDSLTAQANLKRTSLYDLAVRVGVEAPENFIRRFIAIEKQQRQSKRLSRPAAGEST
jgi:energy-coupling factor transport system ATP-binding protein